MKLKSLSNKDRYGNMFSVEFFEPDTTIPMMMVIPDMPDGFNGADTDNHPGDPKGTDTVPAWLTPGENVVNAEASRIPGNQEKIDQMNEEGRQIQKAQGGPIPTYESDGGFIQGLVDTFTLPKAPPGIEYRRMKDGSIGMWAGNTYRGKYKEPEKKESSFSERLGISYNYGGGNIPPMYANQGALAEFLKAEEGLRNEAYLDSAGVPTIGYGSTYGVKMGDKLSDAQANQQLMKDIAVAEEDYNNLVDVDLNPNQQNAVKSLLFNIGGPQFANSRARAALNAGDFDTFQKEASEFRMAGGEVLPGLEARRAREMDLFQTPYETADDDKDTGFSFIKSAQAADDVSDAQMLGNYEIDGVATPPKPEDEGFFSPQVKRFLQYPLESFGMPVPEDAPGKPVGNKLFGTESTIIKEEQAERALMYPAEFLGIPAPVDAPGVPLPNVFDLLPDQDKTIANLNEMRVNERQTEVDKLANRINENQEKGIPVSPELVAAHQEATASLTEAQQVQQQHASEVGAEVAKTAEATAQAQTYNTETGEFDKPTEQDKYEEASGTTATDQQRAALTNAATSASDSEQPPSGDPDVDKEIEKTGEEADPTFVEQAKEAFKGAFGDLFNPKELARMALLYTGSRLMGYSHEGSFAYGAKSYLQRVDQLAADQQSKEELSEQRRFDLAKSNLDNYTSESAQKFMQTLDVNDLVPKTGTTTKIQEVSGSVNFIGKGRVNTYKDDNGVEYVKLDEAKKLGYPSGYVPVSILGDYIQPWDESTMGAKANRTYFEGLLETARKKFSTDDAPIDALPTKLATQLNAEFNDYIRSHGVGINESERTRVQFANVIDKFMADVARAKQEGTDVPTDIAAYVQAEMVIPLTGINSAFLNGINTESLTKLDKKIIQSVEKAPYEKGFKADYKENWKIVEEVFKRVPVDKVEAKALAESIGVKKIVPREDWSNRAEGKNETAFSLWLANTSFDEIQKLVDHFKL